LEVAAIDGDYNDPDTWPIMEANACLIASAPDMAETLALARKVLARAHDRIHAMPRTSDDDLLSTIIKRAVAKATKKRTWPLLSPCTHRRSRAR